MLDLKLRHREALRVTGRSGTPSDTATAAIRQSACASVMPAAACSRRQSPARGTLGTSDGHDAETVKQADGSRPLDRLQTPVDLVHIDRRCKRRLCVLT